MTNMTPKEQDLKNRFVDEYLKDFDGFRACLRLGYTKPFAVEYSREFMVDPYIELQIMDRKGQHHESDDDVDRAYVRSTLREIMMSGSAPQFRIAAAAQLAKILGMEAPTKSQMELNGGGVMIVPTIQDQDWATVAEYSQAKLISAAG